MLNNSLLMSIPKKRMAGKKKRLTPFRTCVMKMLKATEMPATDNYPFIYYDLHFALLKIKVFNYILADILSPLCSRFISKAVIC